MPADDYGGGAGGGGIGDGRAVVAMRSGDSDGPNNGEVNVQIDDYYMDPNYNPNPELFEVKQIVLNIIIQQ